MRVRLYRRLPRVRRILEHQDVVVAERDELLRRVASEQKNHQIIIAERDDLRRQLAIERQKVPLDAQNIVCTSDRASGGEARKISELLKPMDVVGHQRVRKGRNFDGGYVLIDADLANVIVYSFGINNDVSWDLDMAAIGCHVFQYDHTIESLPVSHANFHWFKQGVADKASQDGRMSTIDAILSANDHLVERNIVMKMDIEGGEWGVFESLSLETLNCFSQIVVEMHLFCTYDCVHPADAQHMRRRRKVLEKLNYTHQLVHLHANNDGALGIIAGVTLPDVMELTFVRRCDYEFTGCNLVFPIAIDQPNRPDRPDFYFGAVGAQKSAHVDGPSYFCSLCARLEVASAAVKADVMTHLDYLAGKVGKTSQELLAGVPFPAPCQYEWDARANIEAVFESQPENSDASYFCSLRSRLEAVSPSVRADVMAHLDYLAGKAGSTSADLLAGNPFSVPPQYEKDAISNIEAAFAFQPRKGDSAYFDCLRSRLELSSPSVRNDVMRHLDYLAGKAGRSSDDLLAGGSFSAPPQYEKDAIANIEAAFASEPQNGDTAYFSSLRQRLEAASGPVRAGVMTHLDYLAGKVGRTTEELLAGVQFLAAPQYERDARAHIEAVFRFSKFGS